jgi:hypothetical protein
MFLMMRSLRWPSSGTAQDVAGRQDGEHFPDLVIDDRIYGLAIFLGVRTNLIANLARRRQRHLAHAGERLVEHLADHLKVHKPPQRQFVLDLRRERLLFRQLRALIREIAGPTSRLVAPMSESPIAAVILIEPAIRQLHDDALGDIVRDRFPGAPPQVLRQRGGRNLLDLAHDVQNPFEKILSLGVSDGRAPPVRGGMVGKDPSEVALAPSSPPIIDGLRSATVTAPMLNTARDVDRRASLDRRSWCVAIIAFDPSPKHDLGCAGSQACRRHDDATASISTDNGAGIFFIFLRRKACLRRVAFQTPEFLQADYVRRAEPPILAVPLGRRIVASVLFRDCE